MVNATNPAADSSNVSVNSTIVVIFSEAMDASTISTSTFIVKDSMDTPIEGTVDYQDTNLGATATFIPSFPLAYSMQYTATIAKRVQDLSGNAMVSDYTWHFATGAASTDIWRVISATSAPKAKNYATAVWTGTEMLVWGGYDGTYYLNSGGRYDPATDTWHPISTLGAPSGRAGHAAVWTGTEMIVWGGYDGTYLKSGGRYDPVTDTWRLISIAKEPTGRSAFTAVWSGSEMVIWGGYDGSCYLNSGGRYDPATDTWQENSISGAPAKRCRHTAVWSGTEMIVWGGFGDPDTNIGATGGRYNPAADTWSPTSTTTTLGPRYGHTAVWTGTEMIIWGGYEYNGSRLSANTGFSANTGSRYDPSTDSWQSVSTTGAPSNRFYHVAVWAGDKLIVWGGEDAGIHLSSGGQYSVATDTWLPTAAADAPVGGYSQTAIWTGTEMIVWGGGNNSGARYTP
jgi:N-acetylneuraminic acid mutarotase